MLNRIADFIHGKLDATGYFQKVFPMAQLIEREGMVYPVQYNSNGQQSSVNNFDNYNGMAYIRLTGKERIHDITSTDGMAMCDTQMQIEYPLRLVACVPKAKLSKDDAFSDDRISRSLVSALTQKGGLIKQELKANDFLCFPESVDMDSRRILSEEYQNVKKMQDINYSYSYHAIDFTVTIKIKASCMTLECEEEYYG